MAYNPRVKNVNSTVEISASNISTPEAIIDVSSSNAAMRITQRGSGVAFTVEDETNPDATPFIIDNIGNIGIGKTPSVKLDVNGSRAVTISSTGILDNYNDGTHNIQLGTDATSFYLNATTSTAIRFGNNNTERMRLTAIGNLNIGTDLTSAAARLRVSVFDGCDIEAGSWAQMSSNEGGVGLFGTNMFAYYDGVSVNGYKYLRTHPSIGGAGIAFNTPAANDTSIIGTATPGTAGATFTPSNLLTVKSDGNVGIGQTNPAFKLEVAGTIFSSTGGFRFPDGTTQTTAATAGSNSFGTIAFSGGSPTSVAANSPGATLTLIPGTNISFASDANNDTITINGPSVPTVNNATLTLATSGTGLSVSATPTFTANASTSKTITFTIASDATATANTIALRDAGGNLNATGFSGNGSALSSLNAGNISTGTLPIARGGTGASSFTNATVVIVGATGTFQSAGAGTAGQLLKSQGLGSIPTWQDVAISPNYTANTVAVRDASGNLAANRITVGVDDAAAATYRLIFATTNSTVAGTYPVNIDAGLTFRPDTNLFTATNIACTTSITNAGMVAGSGATVLRNATSFRLEFLSSDQRFKKEIRTITNALASVNALRGVLFKWDNSRIPQEDISPDLVNADKDCVGFIAQEVQAVLPELVHQVGLKDYLGVQYAEMTALLVEAIKELSAKNSALEARLAVLEAALLNNT